MECKTHCVFRNLNNFLGNEKCTRQTGECSMICARPTLLTLTWVSGRVLMSHPELRIIFIFKSSRCAIIVYQQIENNERTNQICGPTTCSSVNTLKINQCLKICKTFVAFFKLSNSFLSQQQRSVGKYPRTLEFMWKEFDTNKHILILNLQYSSSKISDFMLLSSCR